MDEKTEALLGPEPAVDPAAARALERTVEEEDYRLRMQLGGRATLVVIVGLFLLAPFLAGLRALERSWLWLVWALLNLPLLVLAALVLRRGRLPLGHGRFLEGAKARRAALLMLAASMASFFGAGVARQLWEWLLGRGR
ncbi:MAG TPA: hypothetical protein VHM92_11410 [Allosphingosinicella sp.]|nr:hypothetical protein [Allosphingosinicella sp.]